MFAAKIMSKPISVEEMEETLSMLELEFQAVTSLNHPNVIKIYKASTSGIHIDREG